MLLYAVPVVAIFIAFAMIVWLAYVEGGPPAAGEDPPLIRAEAQPIKLRPDDPGGREVENRGAVGELLGEARPGATERLLPPPEEPLELPSPDELAAAADRLERELGQARATDDGDAEPPAAEEGGEPEVAASQGPPPDAEAAIRELIEDLPADLPSADDQAAIQETVESPSGQGPAADRGSESAPASDPEPAAEVAEASPPPVPEQPAREEPALQTEQSIAAVQPAEPAVSPSVAPAARTPAPADRALLEGPHYRVQLAAVRSESDAQRAWNMFVDDYDEVLGGMEPIFERGETTNGVFFRVQVGPYGDQRQAEAMCGELKQRNASCFVLRR